MNPLLSSYGDRSDHHTDVSTTVQKIDGNKGRRHVITDVICIWCLRRTIDVFCVSLILNWHRTRSRTDPEACCRPSILTTHSLARTF
jgi:hypothetical protein